MKQKQTQTQRLAVAGRGGGAEGGTGSVGFTDANRGIQDGQTAGLRCSARGRRRCPVVKHNGVTRERVCVCDTQPGRSTCIVCVFNYVLTCIMHTICIHIYVNPTESLC